MQNTSSYTTELLCLQRRVGKRRRTGVTTAMFVGTGLLRCQRLPPTFCAEYHCVRPVQRGVARVGTPAGYLEQTSARSASGVNTLRSRGASSNGRYVTHRPARLRLKSRALGSRPVCGRGRSAMTARREAAARRGGAVGAVVAEEELPKQLSALRKAPIMVVVGFMGGQTVQKKARKCAVEQNNNMRGRQHNNASSSY